MSWVHTNDKNIAMSSLWLPHNRNQWAEWTVFLILRCVQTEEYCCAAQVESQYFGKMLELLQHYIFNSVISKFPQTDEFLSKLFLYSFSHNKDTFIAAAPKWRRALLFFFFFLSFFFLLRFRDYSAMNLVFFKRLWLQDVGIFHKNIFTHVANTGCDFQAAQHVLLHQL